MFRRRRLVRLIFGILGLGLTLLCCGKSKKTPPAPTTDGLASDWDGQMDYELGAWRFEIP